MEVRKLIGSNSEGDRTADPNRQSNYIPFDAVDRNEYEVMHPEEAAKHLGMVSRTIYKKMGMGEILYTTEKNSKRVLVKKSLIRTAQSSDPVQNVLPIASESSERRSDKSDRLPELIDRVLTLSEQMAEQNKLIHERDQTISTLNRQLESAHNAIAKRNLPAVIDPTESRLAELEKRLKEVEEENQALKSKKKWWPW